MYQSSLQGREERGSSYDVAEKKLLKIFRFLTQSLERMAKWDVKVWKGTAAFTHSGEDTSSSNPSLWQLYCWSGIFYIEGPATAYCAVLLLTRLKHDLACQIFFLFFLAHSEKGRRKRPWRKARLRNLPTLLDSHGLLEMEDKQHLRKAGLCCSMSMLLASEGWAMYSPATFCSHPLLTRITFRLEPNSLIVILNSLLLAHTFLIHIS